MAAETKHFDVAESLNSEERIAAYLEEMFSDGDPKMMARALGDVMRARNISAVAKAMGVSRDTVYSAFSADGNPTLSTLVSAARVLGFEWRLHPIAKAADSTIPNPKKAGPAPKATKKPAPKSARKPGARLPKAA